MTTLLPVCLHCSRSRGGPHGPRLGTDNDGRSDHPPTRTLDR